MTTVSSRGNTVVSTTGTWNNTTNAYDGSVGTNPATYTTWTDATRRGVASITIGGYSFSGVQSGYNIDGIQADVRHMEVASANMGTLTLQLLDSTGANIGSSTTFLANQNPTTATVLGLGVPTTAQVIAGLQVVATWNRGNNTTSTTVSLDQIDLTITYSIPAAMSTLTDDFSTKDTSKWTWSAGASVSSGQLNTTSSGTQNIVSTSVYSLTGSSFKIQGITIPTTSAGAAIYLATTTSSLPATYYGYVFSTSNQVICRESINSSFSDTTVTITDKWFRISESGGNILWDTSADGFNWINRRTKTVSGSININGLYAQVLSANAVSAWDNVNLSLPAGSKINTFTDSFATLDTTTKWNAYSWTNVTNGELNLPANIRDDFNRPDSASLIGPNWTSKFSTMGISSNKAYEVTSFVSSAAVYNVTAPSDDIKVAGTIGVTSGDYNFFYLGSNDSNQVYLRCEATAMTIWTSTSWAGIGNTQRASTTGLTLSTGDKIVFERIGNVYTGYQNGTSRVTWTDSGNAQPRDSSHRMFGIGFYHAGVSNTTTYIEDFAAYDLSGNMTRLESQTYYDLTSSSIFLKLPSTNNSATDPTETFFSLNCTSGAYTTAFSLSFRLHRGRIYFTEYVNGVADYTYATYSATSHAWLRFRESSGTIYWDTSPDGSNWTNQRSKTPTIAGLTNLYIGLASNNNDVVALDNFSRADSTTSVGPDWTTVWGHPGISSNQYYGIDGTPITFFNNAVNTTTAPNDDMKVNATVSSFPALNTSLMLIIASSSGNQVFLEIIGGSTTWRLVTSNTFWSLGSNQTQRASGTSTTVDGDIWSVERTGTLYTVRQNGTSKGTWNDTGGAHPIGSNYRNCGLGIYHNNTATVGRWDDWQMKDLSGAAAGLVVVDNFNVPTAGLFFPLLKRKS